MNVERTLRLLAGTFVTATAAPAVLHSPWWLAFNAFVGLNLFQSALTDRCPAMVVLRRAGFE